MKACLLREGQLEVNRDTGQLLQALSELQWYYSKGLIYMAI